MVGLESEENEKGSTTAGHEKQENGEGQLSRAVMIIRYTPGISINVHGIICLESTYRLIIVRMQNDESFYKVVVCLFATPTKHTQLSLNTLFYFLPNFYQNSYYGGLMTRQYKYS